MTLTIKLDGNWNSFQVANSAPPLSATDSAMPLSARMRAKRQKSTHYYCVCSRAFFVPCSGDVKSHHTEFRDTLLPRRVCCARLCAMPVQHLEASEKAREDILPNKNCGWVVSSLNGFVFKYFLNMFGTFVVCFKNKNHYVNSIRRPMNIHHTA